MRTRMILLALICQCSVVFSEVEFDWATVGDAENTPDTDSSGIRFFGGVDYEFRISKHEVTNEQYAEFLNNVASADPHELFRPEMAIARTGTSGSFSYSAVAGLERHPVTNTTFIDAMRFINWLENGQGTAETESGTYSIEAGLTETRASNATYFLPTDDEWYKAAYYDPTLADGAGGYWKYATRNDETPAFELPPGGTNSVNIWDSNAGGTTEVGAYRRATSYYGTFDQTGNVWEWTELLEVHHPFRRTRGPSWGDSIFFRSVSYPPTSRNNFTGFRVATKAFAPETFRRGDCNGDSTFDVSDAILTLNSLFLGQEPPDCDDACDANDDGSVDISDAIAALGALFRGQGPLPSPGVNDCGVDPSDDGISCARNESCL